MRIEDLTLLSYIVTYFLPAWLYIDVIIVRGGVDLVVMMSILN